MFKLQLRTMDKGTDNPVCNEEIPNVRQTSTSPVQRISIKEDESQNLEEGSCGWGTFTPDCLKYCNTPKGYLLFYSLLAIVQGIIVNGLVNINLSTIEKRYNLASFYSGIISSSYDISFCALCLFVAFYGQKGHKPRWLTFSAFMLGLGSIVFCLPQFINGLYKYGAELKGSLCSFENNHCENCALLCSPNFNFLYIFILGQLLCGVGGVPLYTLGTAYIDECVPHEKSSLYIGCYFVFSVDLQINDSRWLGAWWIGFLMCWVLMMLKNSVFMCLTISTCTEMVSLAGLGTFLPKFMETQFGQTASQAAILGGLVLAPGAIFGQIISGIIISKLKLGCDKMIKMAIIMTTLALTCLAVFIFAKCDNVPLAGVNRPYESTITSNKFELEASCNANCSCLQSFYNPICGANGVQYFSACYGGCTHLTEQIYQNCSCIQNFNHTFVAHTGKCPSTCKQMPIIMCFLLIYVIFIFMSSIPVTVSTLRCVPDSQRSFSLGVQWVFVRLLGSIPGPVLFGAVIDKSCILWNEDDSGIKGACWVYNNARMVHLLVAISKFNSYQFCTIGCCILPTKYSVNPLYSIFCEKNEGEKACSPIADHLAVTPTVFLR
uniref:Solute carrier organic anion transporter family member 4C1 n=1 Tax=Callorhinchus milii TaxID=7868 RepID=A0A4W3KCB1_CALMI